MTSLYEKFLKTKLRAGDEAFLGRVKEIFLDDNLDENGTHIFRFLVGDYTIEKKVQIDDEEAPDELGSLAASAEALRLTAAAPPRNQNVGGDYDG